MRKSPNNFEAERTTNGEDRWNVTYGIDAPSGVDFIISKGENIIEVDFKIVPYPKSDETTSQLLLEAISRHPSNLRLPKNSTSLANILNEAAGTTDSFEISPDTSRTVKLLTEIFRILAIEIEVVAEQAHKIPKEIGYKQVLVDKDSFAAKLLPPVELEEVKREDMHKKLRELGRMLIQSMSEGSTTPAQRALTDMLSKPIKEIFN